jgi:hypothetical protein
VVSRDVPLELGAPSLTGGPAYLDLLAEQAPEQPKGQDCGNGTLTSL